MCIRDRSANFVGSPGDLTLDVGRSARRERCRSAGARTLSDYADPSGKSDLKDEIDPPTGATELKSTGRSQGRSQAQHQCNASTMYRETTLLVTQSHTSMYTGPRLTQRHTHVLGAGEANLSIRAP